MVPLCIEYVSIWLVICTYEIENRGVDTLPWVHCVIFQKTFNVSLEVYNSNARISSVV